MYKKKENIGIIGQGFVGSAIKEGLKQKFTVFTYDVKTELSSCKTMKEVVDNCYIIFICVPTPMDKNGNCYTGIMESVVKEIKELSYTKVLILKTTIPPGTTETLQQKYDTYDFIFNPEFLTEANAIEDFKNQNRIVLGGDSNFALNKVSDIYKEVFPYIPIVKMTSREAEMVKYVTNSFLATKVVFANEMYEICKKLRLDYNNVINTAKLDTRLGESHWKVPGPDGDFGFGGHCFPKDTNAIKNLANQNDVKTEILDSVLEKNDRLRMNKDWLLQKGRAVV